MTATSPSAPPDLLRERGFVVVPMLSGDDVGQLRRRYEDLGLRAEHNYCSIHEPDPSLRRTISDEISELLRARLPAAGFARSRVMGGVFVVKGPTDQFVELHQDPTVVDETRFRSANVWIPLQDVDTHNGCLWVLPGSHHDAPNVRPGNGDDLPSYYANVPRTELWEAMTPIEMRAGEALVYDHRLLHGSQGNHGDELRLAIVAGLRAAGAAPRFYHLDPDDRMVAEFVMEDDDFFTFVNFVPQAGQLARTFPLELEILDRVEYDHRRGSSAHTEITLTADAWPA